MSILLRVLFALAVIGALFAAKGHYDDGKRREGYDKAAGEAQIREAKIKTDAADKLSKATAEAGVREAKLRADLDAKENQRFKENTDHEKIIASYRARARAGDERLSILTRSCGPVSGSATATGTGAAPGPGGEARADLMPGTVDAIFGLAGDSAKLVRDYNAVVDRYNRVRETCNAGTVAP